MIRILHFVMFLLMIGLLSACKKSDDNPDIVINVDDEFYINLFEEINETNRVFQINIRSIYDQDCLNYSIDNNFSLSHQFNRIILTINGFTEPDNCIAGHAPAYKEVPIADINAEVYQFHINLTSAVKNEGRLTISDSDYLLQMQTDDGIVILNTRLYKIPENTIWGYVGYETEAEEAFAEDFVKDLETLALDIDEVGGYDQGYYGYFSILNDRKIELQQNIDSDFHSPFLFFFEGENDEIENLIESHCAAHPELKIHISNARGQEMLCD